MLNVDIDNEEYKEIDQFHINKINNSKKIGFSLSELPIRLQFCIFYYAQTSDSTGIIMEEGSCSDLFGIELEVPTPR